MENTQVNNTENTEASVVQVAEVVEKEQEVQIKPQVIGNSAEDYGSSSIKVLKGLEAVKKRPGMYIGDTYEKGLHHCLWEIIDNSVDEHVAGYCSKIKVVLKEGNKAVVSDNGRGIPVDIHPEEGISAATIAMTVLHAGGKFGGEGSSYTKTGGLHGVGASVVNALSTDFFMTIKRQKKIWFQEFKNGGEPVEALKQIGDMADGEETGTTVGFSPDPKVFRAVEDDGDGTDIRDVIYQFNLSIVRERVELLAYLNPGLSITLVDEREIDEEGKIFEKTWNSNSFLGFLDFITKDKNMAEEVVPGQWFEKEVMPPKGSQMKSSIYVRVALRPHNGSRTEVLSFVNNIYTPGGGSHLTGFRSAVVRTINNYGMENGIIKENLSSDDVMEGLAAAILVRVEEPKFEGQTKDKLGTREAQGAVSQATSAFLSKFFEENPAEAKEWVLRAVRASKARQAADKAREQVNLERVASAGFRMPGKLADCREKNPELTELYFVEGDSAGGSAKQGRDNKTQAILPLRGKILNTHRMTEDNVLKNTEIQSIITALGCGYGENVDLTKLRYHKVVIMTDADVDGAHIATLILTFFHNYMPEVIEGGYIYVAMPPLFRMINKRNPKKSVYLRDDEAAAQFELENDMSQWEKGRFKGLGEMNPEQLWDTTMNPETRTLMRVGYTSGGEEEMNIFNVLMGEEVKPRREFIEENAMFADIQV